MAKRPRNLTEQIVSSGLFCVVVCQKRTDVLPETYRFTWSYALARMALLTSWLFCAPLKTALASPVPLHPSPELTPVKSTTTARSLSILQDKLFKVHAISTPVCCVDMCLCLWRVHVYTRVIAS